MVWSYSSIEQGGEVEIDLSFAKFLPKMAKSGDGMVKEHTRPCKSHHLAHLFAHIGFVAMDGAKAAGTFLIAKLTSRQSFVAIFEEGGAVVAKC